MEIECLINKDLLLKGTCICCLDNIGPYINLATCSHKEFLDAFPIPHFSPYQPDIVCNRCHAILKKVAQFKLQVQESFNILSNKTESLKEDKEIKRNLHISKIVHLNIPEPREEVIDKLKLKLQNTKRPNNIELIEDSNTENSRTKSQNLTKLNNVETALKIINTNTNSLQSLTAYNNFVDLTRTLVEATVKSLYSSPMSTSVLPDLKITKDTISQNYITGSPLKRKTDSQNGIGDESILSTSDNDNTKLERISNIEIDLKEEIKEEMDVEFINKELPRKSNIYTDNNSGVLYNKNLKNFKKIKEDTEIEIIDEPILNASVKKEIHVKGEIKEKSNIDIDKVNKSNAMFVENDNECKDSPKITVLPIENKMQCDDVVILSHYGTAVLPDAVKCDPDNATDSSIVFENCLGKNMENENGQTNQAEMNQNSVNDVAGLVKKRRPVSLCLIPIRLSEKKLKAEREAKLNSKEFQEWEYRCTDCIIGFRFKDNLDDHIKRKHMTKYPELHVTCLICRQVMSDSDVREHHFRHYHRIQCKKCKKQFVLFDEAYDHYSTTHEPLKSKGILQRQLQRYWRLKTNKVHKRNATEVSRIPSADISPCTLPKAGESA